MKKILVFDKGGRKKRLNLIKKEKAPKDFLQGIDFLKSKGLNIEHLSSIKSYKQTFLSKIGNLIEEFFCKISNIGIRPLSVFQFEKKIKASDYVVSLTDGFSISLGFYYYFINKKSSIKLAGGFHRLSDFDRKLSPLIKSIYHIILRKSLSRLDYIFFYGKADQINSIKNFKIPEFKTYIIKFGVDTKFWEPTNKSTFNSDYLFSIGQDPARDFDTLLKVNTTKKIHIHTNLLKKRDDQKFKITNGNYYKYSNSYTDLKIRELYQNSFAVIIPLKDVFQPSGYSVTLQSMSCGKPVILTLTKGLWAPEYFKNNKNCILVCPYKEKEIEEAIEKLSNDKNLYSQISRNSRLTIEKYFSTEVANMATLKLFKMFN